MKFFLKILEKGTNYNSSTFKMLKQHFKAKVFHRLPPPINWHCTHWKHFLVQKTTFSRHPVCKSESIITSNNLRVFEILQRIGEWNFLVCIWSYKTLQFNQFKFWFNYFVIHLRLYSERRKITFNQGYNARKVNCSCV